MFYTYAHYKPEGGLFYIGKGKRRRAYSMDGRNSHWQNIVNKYGRPHVELLASWKTEEEALDHERLLIASFRDMGFKLANKADGGVSSSGHKFTDQQRKNLSDAHLGQVAWNKGLKGVTTAWNKGLEATENQKKAFNKLLTCHCGAVGRVGIMTKHHMDNCGKTNPYSARVTVNGIRFQIGRFKTKEEAKAFQEQYIKEHNIVRKPQAKRNTPSWNKGIPLSDETKLKLSASLKGRVAPNKGIKLSDEEKAKIRVKKIKNKELKGLSCQVL